MNEQKMILVDPYMSDTCLCYKSCSNYLVTMKKMHNRLIVVSIQHMETGEKIDKLKNTSCCDKEILYEVSKEVSVPDKVCHYFLSNDASLPTVSRKRKRTSTSTSTSTFYSSCQAEVERSMISVGTQTDTDIKPKPLPPKPKPIPNGVCSMEQYTTRRFCCVCGKFTPHRREEYKDRRMCTECGDWTG